MTPKERAANYMRLKDGYKPRMTDQEKTNTLFKIWLDSGMTKTDFAQKCGWKSSSILCRLISGKIKTTYEHLEIACKITNRNFKIEIR